MNKIFDSHSHYNDDSFKDDYCDVLQKIADNGVGTVLNVGADIHSSRLAVKQAEECDFMYCSVGIHPHDSIQARDEAIMEEIEQLIAHQKTVAVGEAGLDYHYDDSWSPEVQKEAFVKQILLANKYNKPLIIHTREAMQDTLDILNEYPLNSGVVHCYSGSRESCKQLVKMGLYIGFTGVITFKNARRALESLKVVPLDRLLIETDCPYMAPEPNRGKRCDSSMLHFVAQKMADELGMTKDEIIRITRENAERLFNIR
ncbi:MAG: TatD family hydrolase [Oscillospiraceae bacterium]|nr:TatD family hydrolase [Oscillospiraceae bacterium]